MMAKTRGELVPYICPECGSKNIIHDDESGETICSSCGLVIAEPNLDTGPERRAFTQTEMETRTRVGMPLSFSLYDKGLSTVIRIGRDAYGRELPLKTREQMLRLRRWQNSCGVHASVDKNLAQAMAELERLSERLHIPSPIQETAAVIYRKALKKGLVRGRSISAIAAASLYAACRLTRTPRTLRELASHTPMDKKDLSKYYRLLVRELDLRMPVANSQLRVPKIAALTGVGEETQRMAVEILREAERLKATSGRNPMGLAAAALYIACLENGENRTQKVIADASGITEVTVRNRYKELKEILGIGGMR